MELLTEDYIITSQKSLAISITVGYDSATHLLVKMEFSGASAAQIEYFGNYIPATLEKLPKLAERLSWNVRPVDMNLDFENFYELYGNKVGKKEAQNRWKRMTKSEKVKAILFIPKYENHLKRSSGIQRKYPATYLNSEPWND